MASRSPTLERWPANWYTLAHLHGESISIADPSPVYYYVVTTEKRNKAEVDAITDCPPRANVVYLS